jgi:hypothetical protein
LKRSGARAARAAGKMVRGNSVVPNIHYRKSWDVRSQQRSGVAGLHARMPAVSRAGVARTLTRSWPPRRRRLADARAHVVLAARAQAAPP